ncbi:BacL2 family protein [Bacillus andreraoultii]|uniref:BacL2 family protein n=1 Tax=Bacillus andreraoultii TaxID=1499685 RepID=UPI000539E092|nr:BacL2 family protein [Bacillus andreraoultii]
MVKNLWVEVEELAVQYVNEEDEIKRQAILGEALEVAEGYVQTCVNNAVNKARNYGLEIPREDFLSHFMEALWKAIEGYDVNSHSKFKSIILRRFHLAEATTWRLYRTKGNNGDKDGYTYDSVRWDSLDRTVSGSNNEEEKSLGEVIVGEAQSAEDVAIDNFEIEEILSGFEKENERYAKVIRFMYLGYEGDDLAIVTGEADKYNAKVRKLVQRAKQSFKKYMDELAFN